MYVGGNPIKYIDPTGNAPCGSGSDGFDGGDIDSNGGGFDGGGSGDSDSGGYEPGAPDAPGGEGPDIEIEIDTDTDTGGDFDFDNDDGDFDFDNDVATSITKNCHEGGSPDPGSPGGGSQGISSDRGSGGSNSTFWDGLQLGLGSLGLIPFFGIVPDFINTIISIARGDWSGAAGDALAMVPIMGIFTGVGRIGARGGNILRSTTNLLNRVTNATVRTTRAGGKGVRVQLRSGRILDVTTTRVKEFIPNPRNPGTGMSRVRFRPGSGGFKRTPTQRDLELLDFFTR